MFTHPKLSLDVISDIINEVDDYATLSSCSLTFTGLRRQAQKRLFRRTTITVGSITPGSGHADGISQLTQFLLSNDHIAGSVRCLTIRVVEDINGASGASHWPANKTLLSAFPRVQQLFVVDVGRSRYRGWWDMGGAFADALQALLLQESVAALQLGAPGREREFEWPAYEDSYYANDVDRGTPHFVDFPGKCSISTASSNGTAMNQLRNLRATVFRDRPDNIRTVQGVFQRWAGSLNHVWLAFPSHSLPYYQVNAPLSLNDLIVLQSLVLSFNADSLFRPAMRILDTISKKIYGTLKLTIHMQRSWLSLSREVMVHDCWRDLDAQLMRMLDSYILRALEVEISVFGKDSTFEPAVQVLREALPGIHARNCLAFKKRVI